MIVQQKINVLHIRDSSGIFGAERVILTIGKNLRKDLFNFHLLCLQGSQRLADPLIKKSQDLGIHVTELPVTGRLNMRAIILLRHILITNNISLIHSHDFKSNFYVFIAAAFLGIPKIITAHGSTRDSLKKRIYLSFDEQVNYRFFDKIIAVSEDLKNNLVSKNTSVAKILVIQNGLDFELLNQEREDDPIQSHLVLPEKKIIFAVVGRLFPDKGHSFFLEAFAKLRLKFPDILALFVGEGPNLDVIRKQISDNDLEDFVILAGIRKDMQSIYERVDFLVIPSLTEGLPYVLLEAMANHLPVIASAVGDIPRLIENGKSGLLCPPGNSLMLEDRMDFMINNPAEASIMAEKAYRLVSEKYGYQCMVAQYEQVYLSMVKES